MEVQERQLVQKMEVQVEAMLMVKAQDQELSHNRPQVDLVITVDNKVVGHYGLLVVEEVLEQQVVFHLDLRMEREEQENKVASHLILSNTLLVEEAVAVKEELQQQEDKAVEVLVQLLVLLDKITLVEEVVVDTMLEQLMQEAMVVQAL